MPTGQFGVAGLGVMGQSLALNIERNGFAVIGYNRDEPVVAQARQKVAGKKVHVTTSYDEFAASLERPRRVLLMITAGKATDAVINELKTRLEPGDVIIDGGNAHFADTDRRHDELAKHGIHFVGCGVSGGEEGALWGPSLMPGGDRAAYDKLAPIFEKIAAKTDDGPCVAYVGRRSAGHYVKMVHNGIEYGIMQVICEVYDILRKSAQLPTIEIRDVFKEWADGEIGGFLLEVSAACLGKSDPETGQPLVEMILDTAGQKGTGKWTAQTALDFGVPTPTLSMAVEARILSGLKTQRVEAAQVLRGPKKTYKGDRQKLVTMLYRSLYLAKVACYGQGMALIQEASKELDYGINLSEVARIWKGGCIIRSKLLDPIKKAYKSKPNLPNLLVHRSFRSVANRFHSDLRRTVRLAADTGVAVPCLGATLAYLDSYRSEFLPANLLQAQRDNFGAHTYKRLDREGVFHTDWSS